MLDEYRIQTKSGEIKWILHTWQKIIHSGNPFKSADRDQNIIIHLVRDVTDLKQAQINQDKLKEQIATLQRGIDEGYLRGDERKRAEEDILKYNHINADNGHDAQAHNLQEEISGP